MLEMVLMTRSGVLFISSASWMGPIAWAARSCARPSQNCARLNTAFSTVGELRPPRCQACPMERGCRSTPAVPRLWQLLQLMNQLEESLGSNQSMRPSSSFSSEYGLCSSMGVSWGMGSKMFWARTMSWSSACGASSVGGASCVGGASSVGGGGGSAAVPCRNAIPKRPRINAKAIVTSAVLIL